MSFPLELTVDLSGHNESYNRKVTLHKGLTVLLGPNGSGKTHLLRGLKKSLSQHTNGKHVRFLSAGRMGLLERFRSDYDGHRGFLPDYNNARYGSKSDAARRHKMETINGDFHTLAERADILIKIQERLRKLFKRDIFIEWDGGELKVLFSRLDIEGKSYSSGREASGLMHLVGILAALYDDDVGALLLDEPEVSLHPQLQAFLLHEIISVSGHPSEGSNKKIVIIATHSTEMLQIQKAEDLLSLVFCYDLMNEPVQIPVDAGELNSRKVQNLVARLGQEHKLSLFSKRPLLVEGPSDVIICSALANKLDIHLEAAGSQLLPVIGKGQMSTVAKLLRLLGKSPVALADADGISDGLDLVNSYLNGNATAELSANKLGFSSTHQMVNPIFADFCQLVDFRWNEISAIAELHPYWVNKKTDEEIQAKRRSAFCTLFIVDDNELSNLASDNRWVNIKTRLTVLLDLLEQCGLFILRKGSVESYYQSSDPFTSIGKPGAAVGEVDHINQLSHENVNAGYSDLIRCIQHASSTEVICEADALRDLLLSIVAPAHARLKSGEFTTNFNVLARSILGERSKIFGLVIEDEKLIISIESNILNIKGFPVTIGKDDDVLKCINAALAVNL
ncbi:AAA family ATPase [Pantoea sp. Bo_2]|uniref:ATP-dependent nuclease n=1 Tax=unclassified Pantoea TaxID=2630326 RepID=UPI0012318A18|nr:MULTISPECIES: AAA family ATPase [unclassified Pantoea]KAA5943941.1 AAA family ATPase [Pantoea sp. VH_3]KAA5951426.1 AAA family ATPase [Pantoea sp. VH_25]KAA6044115.1 AAA family ATPase [Pantoea sp. FN_2b]KAA6048969.1 AAA family ATPase [Pantoea sp. Bo_5]KAA6057236.1 AAA family ATPase [Pantoea sp. Bo_46]